MIKTNPLFFSDSLLYTSHSQTVINNNDGKANPNTNGKKRSLENTADNQNRKKHQKITEGLKSLSTYCLSAITNYLPPQDLAHFEEAYPKLIREKITEPRWKQLRENQSHMNLVWSSCKLKEIYLRFDALDNKHRSNYLITSYFKNLFDNLIKTNEQQLRENIVIRLPNYFQLNFHASNHSKSMQELISATNQHAINIAKNISTQQIIYIEKCFLNDNLKALVLAGRVVVKAAPNVTNELIPTTQTLNLSIDVPQIVGTDMTSIFVQHSPEEHDYLEDLHKNIVIQVALQIAKKSPLQIKVNDKQEKLLKKDVPYLTKYFPPYGEFVNHFVDSLKTRQPMKECLQINNFLKGKKQKSGDLILEGIKVINNNSFLQNPLNTLALSSDLPSVPVPLTFTAAVAQQGTLATTLFWQMLPLREKIKMSTLEEMKKFTKLAISSGDDFRTLEMMAFELSHVPVQQWENHQNHPFIHLKHHNDKQGRFYKELEFIYTAIARLQNEEINTSERLDYFCEFIKAYKLTISKKIPHFYLKNSFHLIQKFLKETENDITFRREKYYSLIKFLIEEFTNESLYPCSDRNYAEIKVMLSYLFIATVNQVDPQINEILEKIEHSLVKVLNTFNKHALDNEKHDTLAPLEFIKMIKILHKATLTQNSQEKKDLLNQYAKHFKKIDDQNMYDSLEYIDKFLSPIFSKNDIDLLFPCYLRFLNAGLFFAYSCLPDVKSPNLDKDILSHLDNFHESFVYDNKWFTSKMGVFLVVAHSLFTEIYESSIISTANDMLDDYNEEFTDEAIKKDPFIAPFSEDNDNESFYQNFLDLKLSKLEFIEELKKLKELIKSEESEESE